MLLHLLSFAHELDFGVCFLPLNHPPPPLPPFASPHRRPIVGPLPPPTAVITGPSAVNVTVNASTTVQFTSNASTCNLPPCASLWLVQCPSGAARNYTGDPLSLVVGPGGDIDTTGQTSAFTCNVTLTLNDTQGQLSTAAVESILVT